MFSGDRHLDSEVGGGEHVHQTVDAEPVDLASDQVGDPRLGDADESRHVLPLSRRHLPSSAARSGAVQPIFARLTPKVLLPDVGGRFLRWSEWS